MPSRLGLRPLKAWRYVAFFSPELMVCLAAIRIGPFGQEFWAVWDRRRGRLHERTVRRRGPLQLSTGRVRLHDGSLSLELELDEEAGIEAICPAGGAYSWTRKQAGIAARGTVLHAGHRCLLEGSAVVDDTAAYYPRHTRWRWSAGVGTTAEGAPAAWNLVSGVGDPPQSSERTVWLEGRPREVGPVRFADDLSAVDGLRFHAEATRRRRENLLLIRSDLRQPFGTFAGVLPGGIVLAQGAGVMEEHDVWW